MKRKSKHSVAVSAALTPAAWNLYFTADDGATGRELWGLLVNRAPQGEGEDYTTLEDVALVVPAAGILAKAPNKAQFEIPEVQISDEPYGLGMRKGDKQFVDFVNKTILEMEKSGEAKKIFDKWFGPSTQFHLQRNFKVTADK